MAGMRKSQNDELALTEAGLAYLSSSAAPSDMKTFMTRNRRTNTAEIIRACRTVAALAQAEADALVSVHYYNEVSGDLADLAEAKAEIDRLRRQNEAIDATVTEQRRQIERMTARTAMAVHAEGGQR